MPEEDNEPEMPNEAALSPQSDVKDESVAPKEPWKRESIWVRASEAIKLSTLPRKNFRQTDKITDFLVTLSFFSLIFLVFAPINAFRPQIALFCDLLCITTVFAFIFTRLGVISTIEQRKAVLIWDIILGAAVLGLVLAVNMGILLLHLSRIYKF